MIVVENLGREKGSGGSRSRVACIQRIGSSPSELPLQWYRRIINIRTFPLCKAYSPGIGISHDSHSFQIQSTDFKCFFTDMPVSNQSYRNQERSVKCVIR